jgi:peptidoglycan-N-acetylglucosamine deacetylase
MEKKKSRRPREQVCATGSAPMWLVILSLAVILAFAVGGFFWYACAITSSQFLGPALVRGPSEGSRITLTFDDGPAGPYTEQVLDILRERKVQATFFVCGKNVERAPDILRRIVREGHAIGNHTYSHPFIYFRSRKQIAKEIDQAQEVIKEVLGIRPTLFRPPYGARWFGLMPVLRERGMQLVQWSDTGYDWKLGSAGIVQATLKGLRPGAVILLHDGQETNAPAQVNRSETVRALPAIIDGARKLGFSFVPIQEFLGN